VRQIRALAKRFHVSPAVFISGCFPGGHSCPILAGQHLLLLSATDPRRGNRHWTGADLVLEVVSPDDPQRDLMRNRREYARAGIPEYWIVNPVSAQILVLRLAGTTYVEHGVFTRGAQATSALLEGFTVAVAAVLDAV
jgi:hypothetical protein